jgi:hypothetical protein
MSKVYAVNLVPARRDHTHRCQGRLDANKTSARRCRPRPVGRATSKVTGSQNVRIRYNKLEDSSSKQGTPAYSRGVT